MLHTFRENQCCESGIRCFLTLGPGIRDGKNPEPGSDIQDEYLVPVSVFGLKILEIFYADPDTGSRIFSILDLWSGMEKIWIRDKHPGSATLIYERRLKLHRTRLLANSEKNVLFVGFNFLALVISWPSNLATGTSILSIFSPYVSCNQLNMTKVLPMPVAKSSVLVFPVLSSTY